MDQVAVMSIGMMLVLLSGLVVQLIVFRLLFLSVAALLWPSVVTVLLGPWVASVLLLEMVVGTNP